MSNSESNNSVRHRAAVPKDQCPMALTAELLGDRWTLLILREAFYGVQRYDDMLQDLGAPRATLTDRLNKLLKQKILERHPYQEKGERMRHAYKLSAKGRALGKVLISMSEWGETHLTKSPAPAHLAERNTNTHLRIAFLTDEGREVPETQTKLYVKPSNKT